MRLRRLGSVALLLLLAATGCGKDPAPSGTGGSGSPAASGPGTLPGLSGAPDKSPGASPPGVDLAWSAKGAVPRGDAEETPERDVPAGGTSRWYERLQEGKKIG